MQLRWINMKLWFHKIHMSHKKNWLKLALLHISLIHFLSLLKFDIKFISFQSHYWSSDHYIFCTCHDSTDVMSCAKFCTIHFSRLCKRVIQVSIEFELCRKNLIVKWAPNLSKGTPFTQITSLWGSENILGSTRDRSSTPLTGSAITVLIWTD